MILWTIQPKIIHDKLLSDGIVYCDGRKSDRYFRHAYKWMSKKMREFGIPVKSYPIWAWYKYHSPPNKYSRRISLSRAKWEANLHVESCLIEFDAPDHLVVLSDFDSWHSVLNNFAVTNSDAEENLIDELERKGIDTKEIIEKTWDRVFDVDKDNYISEFAIQACIPYLKVDWVKKAEHFIVTKRSLAYKKIYGEW